MMFGGVESGNYEIILQFMRLLLSFLINCKMERKYNKTLSCLVIGV